MKSIDLTQDRDTGGPRVGMITRFPPSASASAPASLELAQKLVNRYGLQIEVIRLVLPGEAAAAGRPVVMDLNPHWHLSAHHAAQRANRCDVALVQIDRHIPLSLIGELMSELETHVVLCVDNVPAVGSPALDALAGLGVRAEVVVVHSETARRRLEARADGQLVVEVIPHGSPWVAMEPGPEPRSQLLTWGFLAPGMGAERVVRALALLGDLQPLPRYRLIGVADPGWTRPQAASYRADLVSQAEGLGVADRLELVPMLHSRNDLAAEIARTDLIAVVYDSRDRAGSRILTEAVSTGRPVVATAFPGAIELLASGAGMTVAHDDDEAMAAAIRRYLTDDDEYRRAFRMASVLSAGLNWDETARRFAAVLNGQVGSRELTVEVNS